MPKTSRCVKEFVRYIGREVSPRKRFNYSFESIEKGKQQKLRLILNGRRRLKPVCKGGELIRGLVSLNRNYAGL